MYGFDKDEVKLLDFRVKRVDNGRFRHSARFQRWRPDRTGESCTFEQLEVVPPVELHQVFGA